MRWLPRSNSGTPTQVSSARTRRLNAGCVMFRRSAAREKFRQSASARKSSSQASSISVQRAPNYDWPASNDADTAFRAMSRICLIRCERHDMKSYRIAAIPGDGIGNEVLPEGIRVLEAAGKRFGLSFTFDHFDWSCEHYAETRPHDAGRRARPDPQARRDLSRRGRVSRRSGSCLAVGAADPDPARLQSIRQSSPLPACCAA